MNEHPQGPSAGAHRRRRVLAVTLAPDVWGAEHSLMTLALELRGLGTDVVLAAPAGGDLERRWRAEGLAFRALQVAPRVGLRPLSGTGFVPPLELARQGWRGVVAVGRLARIIREVDADVVHSNALLTHLDCIAAARLTGRRSVVELHDVVPPGPGRELLGVVTLAADASVAVSSVVRDQVRPALRRRVEVVGQGIDLQKFRSGDHDDEVRARLTADPAALLVGVVGRLDPVKRVEDVIEAVAAVRAAGIDVHLAVIGGASLDSGGYTDRLRRTAAELLPGAHRFTGPLDDVPAAMRSIDVLVNACRVEAFGLVVLEAQASGASVVVASTTGSVDFVEDGVTGAVFDPAGPRLLADVLVGVLRDPDARRVRAAAALEGLAGLRSAGARARALDAVYGSLSPRRPSPPQLASRRRPPEPVGRHLADRSSAMSPVDQLWSTTVTLHLVGPLEMPALEDLRTAAVAVARALPQARIGLRVDADGGRWVDDGTAPETAARESVLVHDVVDGADPRSPQVLRALRALCPPDTSVRWIVVGDHLALLVNHATGDGQLMSTLLGALVATARTGALPAGLPAPATDSSGSPLLSALRHHYARSPRRVVDTLRSARPGGGPAAADGAPTAVLRPSPAVVTGEWDRAQSLAVKAWRQEHARGVSLVAIHVVLVREALREVGLPVLGSPVLLFDARRYLPPGTVAPTNFVAGLDLPVGEHAPPAEVDGAIKAAGDAARPLSAMTAGVLVTQVQRGRSALRAALRPRARHSAVPVLPVVARDHPRPSLTVTVMGRAPVLDKLPWTAGLAGMHHVIQATPAPQGITACIRDLGQRCLTSLSFHDSVFDRSALQEAADLISTTPVDLLERHRARLGAAWPAPATAPVATPGPTAVQP